MYKNIEKRAEGVGGGQRLGDMSSVKSRFVYAFPNASCYNTKKYDSCFQQKKVPDTAQYSMEKDNTVSVYYILCRVKT